MTAATQEQPPRSNPPHAMSASAHCQPPQGPSTGEPPPAETDGQEPPTDEPGYGHGV